ncbi:MAG: hypothetical protein ABIH24_05530 [Verrucomicrobiota bacterium]
MFCKNIMLRGSALFAIGLLVASAYPESPEVATFDFAKFNEDNWIKVRDPAVKDIGGFLQKEGYIQNYVKTEHTNSHSLEAGHALRLLKDYPFKDGRIETELMLVGKAAPSIYFRTQVDNQVHKETYNLVVFDFSSTNNKYYHGLNLWKWKEKWPTTAKSYSNWLLLASWAFPVPLNEKVKIAVETDGADIKVYFNDQLKGSVYDPDPIAEGCVGICSCEGVNNFYNFKVKKKQ